MNRKMTDAEVKHLRQLLAWMRCEYCLDEDMQRGALGAVKQMLDAVMITNGQAEKSLIERADQIKQVPKYVRHGVKMLTKLLREIDGIKGDVMDVAVRDVQAIEFDPEDA